MLKKQVNKYSVNFHILQLSDLTSKTMINHEYCLWKTNFDVFSKLHYWCVQHSDHTLLTYVHMKWTLSQHLGINIIIKHLKQSSMTRCANIFSRMQKCMNNYKNVLKDPSF